MTHNLCLSKSLRLYFFILSGCVLSFKSNAQFYRVKAGAFAFPINFGTAHIGIERLNEKHSASWQLYYCIAIGAVALDIGDTKRKWAIIERSYYKGKSEKIKFIYSFFGEIGSRIKYPGYIHPSPDSIPLSWNYSEVSMGAAIGVNIAFGKSKRTGFQVLAGPKIIITAKGIERLYNANTKTYFTIAKTKNIMPGFRYSGSLYYQFKIKKSSRLSGGF